MEVNRLTKGSMVFLLVFALFIGYLQTPVYGVSQDDQETISVFGNDLIGDLLTETPFNLDANSTALDVLVKTIGSTNVEISDSTYGKMITGINGLKAKDTFFWAFYINGISAQVGPDSYMVQKGDHLSFRYVDWTIAPEKTASIKITGTNGVMKEAKSIEFKGEPTAFQLLKVVYGDKIKFSESQYGKMITSIDGLEAEGKNYWAFYVNGQMGTVGADSYQLKAGDEISFQYESWENPSDDTQNENTQPIGETISPEKLQKSIDLVSQYVLKNQVGEWEAIALAKAGKKLPENYLNNVTKVIKDKKGRFSKITEYERYTLGILAAGGNPTNVAGYNLVESIYNGDVTKQGLNGMFYALIALDSADFKIPNTAKWTREKLVSHLIAKQNQDGGWSWDGSEKSDLDSTAMVLTSLAPYKNDVKVKSAVDAGLQYLSAQYLEGKIDNSSTAAQVVVAISSIGLDTTNQLFVKENTNLISYLLSFQNNDGGFDWQGGNKSDLFSTGQAIQAIVSLQLSLNGKGPLYHFPIVPSKVKPEDTSSNENQPPNSNPKNPDLKNGPEGKPLPNTATNQYNYLLFGFLLLLIGAVIFILDKRKKA